MKNGDNGVLIVRFPNGRASGDAFVIFNTEDDMEAALAKNKGDMMGRYIDLFKSSIKEFLLVCVFLPSFLFLSHSFLFLPLSLPQSLPSLHPSFLPCYYLQSLPPSFILRC